LLLIDRTGIVVNANNRAAEICGESEMLQRNVIHICRDLDFIRGVKICLAGTHVEIEIERGDRIYSVYFSPVFDGGEPGGGAILLFDNTAKYEMEKQRREFSANVSHELKTPLTSISAFAEMIESGMAKKDDIRGFAGKISVQSKRLISIIDDIIRLSEFDEGTTIQEKTEFDLFELALNTAEALREKSEEKQVTVSITGEHLQITANKRMIDELLYNLIDNAIKYNIECGTVEVALSFDDIPESAPYDEAEGRYCIITVSDTGVGIPPEHQSRVFERFYRADKSRYRKTGGTGLGMSIVKHIAEHHNGKVELKSDENIGTTVTCWIKM
jgi:two-component system phosphate regulon sensor histidine kinase PhoR